MALTSGLVFHGTLQPTMSNSMWQQFGVVFPGLANGQCLQTPTKDCFYPDFTVGHQFEPSAFQKDALIQGSSCSR
jgi:hypothetical protein